MAKHEVCLLRFLGDNWLVVSTSIVYLISSFTFFFLVNLRERN